MIARMIMGRPRVTFAFTAVAVITGLFCMRNLPVERSPAVLPPSFRIVANVAGMDAGDMDRFVSSPLAQVVSDIPDVLYHSTVSTDGEGMCNVRFRVGVDEDRALWQLHEAIRRAALLMPPAVAKEEMSVVRSADEVVLECAFLSRNDAMPPVVSPALKSQILAVDGVDGVEIAGERIPVLRVVLDSVRLAGHGLTVADVARVLEAHRTAGGMLGSSQNGIFRVDGFKLSVADLEDVVIREDPATGGRILLKSVACVVFDSKCARRHVIDGREAVVLRVRRKNGANAAETALKVREIIGKWIKETDGVDCEYLADSLEESRTFLSEILMAPLLAAGLVFTVLFLFWRSIRETIVPMAVAAVSIVVSFVFQALMGFTFNALTIFGLVLVIGSLVDDALVVIEMARSDRLSRRHSPWDAMAVAVGRSFDVLAVSTAISVICYLPLVFIQGVAAEMYLQFAFTSCMALALSAVFAATLAPVLFVTLVRSAPEKCVKRAGVLSWCARGWLRVCHYATTFWAARPGLTTVVLLLVVISFVPFRRVLPKTLFGDTRTDRLLVEVARHGEGNLADSERISTEVSRRLKSMPQVRRVLSVSGSGVLNGGGNRFVRMTVDLARSFTPSEANRLVRNIEQRMSDIGGARITVLRPSAVRAVGRFEGLEFHLCALDGRVRDLSVEARHYLKRIGNLPEVAGVVASAPLGDSRVKLSVDASKAESLGVSPEAAGAALKRRFMPRILKGFVFSDRILDVELTESVSGRLDVNEISRLMLPVSGGGLVSATSLGTVTEEVVPQSIERFGGLPSLGCVVRLKPGATPEKVARAVMALEPPRGIAIEWAGATVQETANRGGTRIMIGLSLLFAYLLLAAWYESWSLPLPAVGTAVIAVFGAFVGLYAMGAPLDVHAQVALVAVVGIALKGSSLIVDAIRDEHEKGCSLMRASLAGMLRVFRPVQMTILTSLFGVLPFLFSLGVELSAQRVLGVVSVSGILSTLLCGFSLTPALYVVAYRVHSAVSKNRCAGAAVAYGKEMSGAHEVC